MNSTLPPSFVSLRALRKEKAAGEGRAAASFFLASPFFFDAGSISFIKIEPIKDIITRAEPVRYATLLHHIHSRCCCNHLLNVELKHQVVVLVPRHCYSAIDPPRNHRTGTRGRLAQAPTMSLM